MKYHKACKTPSQLFSLTAFIALEFERFVPAFEQYRDEYNSYFTLERKPRLRISYNRKNSKIPLIKDKLLSILSYLKNNPLQQYYGLTYRMTQLQWSLWVHFLSKTLLKTLKILGKLPDKNHLKGKIFDRTMPRFIA